MPTNLALYINSDMPLTQELMQQFAPDAVITASPFVSDERSTFHVQWDDLSIHVNLMPPEQVTQHLQSALSFAMQLSAPPDALNRLQNTQQVIGLLITPGIDAAGHVRTFVLAFARALDGLFYRNTGFYDGNDKLIFGIPGAKASFFQQDETPSMADFAGERKAATMRSLQAQGIPFSADVLTPLDDDTLQLRDRESIAWRTMVLRFIAEYAYTESANSIKLRIQHYRLKQHFTRVERRFIVRNSPEDERDAMNWRFEAYYALLWVLGFVDAMDYPDIPQARRRIVQYVDERTAEQFLRDARLRPVGEILDVLDLTRHYHWAIVDAQQRNQPVPAGLNATVVYQRLYALNWVVRHENAAWDDITVDLNL